MVPLILAAFFAWQEASVRGQGPVMTMDHRDNATFVATAFLLDRVENVNWAADGTVIVDSPYAGGSYARADNFARQFGIIVTLREEEIPVKYELRRPRVGVSKSPWSVAVFDRFRVPYAAVEGRELRDFDSIVAGETDDSLIEFARAGRTLIVFSTPGEGDRHNPLAFGLAPELPALFAEEPCGKGRIIRLTPTEGGSKLLLNAVYLASAHVL